MSTHYIVLVPGFFGFETLGELPYFAHVREILEDRLATLGVKASVRAVSTLPTSSIPSRAFSLAAAIDALPPGPVHVVGHSTGALDGRLMLSPTASLGVGDQDRELVERAAERVRTLVSIAAPNAGTPVASFFTSVAGQRMLELLAVLTLYALKYGGRPIRSGGVRKLMRRLQRIGGLRGTVVENAFDVLFGDTTPNGTTLEQFIAHVHDDQTLIPQLTPDALDIFNSAIRDREDVHYGCVVTKARPPGVKSTISVGMGAYGQIAHAVYALLWRITSTLPPEKCPPLNSQQAQALVAAYGKIPSSKASDGMVPTRTQVRGELIHAAKADHLDVLGYFHDPKHDPPHVDWLATGTGFNRARFEALWHAVADYICRGVQTADQT